MFKKILLILLLSANTFELRAVNDCTCNSQYNEWSTQEKILLCGLLIVHAHGILPAVVPSNAATVVGAAANQVLAYLIPTSTLGKVSLGLTVAGAVRPYIVQTTEEKLNQLLKEKAQKEYTTRKAFVACLKQNKFDSPRNNAGRPSACEDLAFAYALVVGMDELNRRTEAFKEGKCFCS